jgi:hypothetical protein
MSCFDEPAGHDFAVGANVDEMKIHRHAGADRLTVLDVLGIDLR